MKHAYINGMILDGSKEMEPQRGKVIEHPTVKKMPEVEKELDQFL